MFCFNPSNFTLKNDLFLFLKDKTKQNTYWVNFKACVIDGYKYLYLQELNHNVAKNCFMSREQL